MWKMFRGEVLQPTLPKEALEGTQEAMQASQTL
jgi:hypothetical protein